VSMQHAVDISKQSLIDVVQVLGSWGSRHPCGGTDDGVVVGRVLWSLCGGGGRDVGGGVCGVQANHNCIGPHGIRCLVKVAFLSVHGGHYRRIMDSSIGGGIGIRNWE